MRIVIDLQGAQSTGSRTRGIGRYCLSLTEAMARCRDENEIFIVLNGSFADSVDEIRNRFSGLLPEDNIRVWNAPGPFLHIEKANDFRRSSAELIREAFIASLSPDVIYVMSLFEGLTDDAVTSIGQFNKAVPTAVTLFDLIPLINRSPYLDNPLVEAWYEEKVEYLKRADLLLAISESSRSEGIEYLGFAGERIVTVGTAADAQFVCLNLEPHEEADIRERYGLSRAFVMYTGGIDHRKNVEGLIRAYSRLPLAVREQHQLALVCAVSHEDRVRLAALAKLHGLTPDELVLTGFVPERDLIALYNLCKLFIFPSWHEGFGLPALEAMWCGAPVVAANTSSLPEVVGREDALFDPHNDKSIADCILRALTDEAYRLDLIEHGSCQSRNFSWAVSGKIALDALVELFRQSQTRSVLVDSSRAKPKLAYVSPLPPERSGIADYSGELLRELARYYQLDVIVAQDSITDEWITENCSIRDVQWFMQHHGKYARVLYHFGNSHYHEHMFELLSQVPGVVVLHDFFLSGIVAYRANEQWLQGVVGTWEKELYLNHGYKAVHDFCSDRDLQASIDKYPCNKGIVEKALGVIVHSKFSRSLAVEWIDQETARDWSSIPLLRASAKVADKFEARRALGIDSDEFLVCTFGLLGPTKLNHRLLDAWLASKLGRNERCHLVFVGENEGQDYGRGLVQKISRNQLGSRIHITGWVEPETFINYLNAADMAVQLRGVSRGETSAAVFDCMNYGLPTIINANGSMAELPRDVLRVIPDEFEDHHLVSSLEEIWTNKQLRKTLGEGAAEFVREAHAPSICAEQYFKSIEGYYRKASFNTQALIRRLGEIKTRSVGQAEVIELASSIALNQQRRGDKQLLLDISMLVQHDAKTGIQRVVRNFVERLLESPPAGYRVEPVYAVVGQPGYRYARKFTTRLLGAPDHLFEDEYVDTYEGDVFLGLDLHYHVVFYHAGFYERLLRQSVKVHFMVYDMLPVLYPQYFEAGMPELHQKWLNTVSNFDGVICISRSVANDYEQWAAQQSINRRRSFHTSYVHLGAELEGSGAATIVSKERARFITTLTANSSFLMVGTVEPRKGHSQVLMAFEELWSRKHQVNLVIAGKQGWMVESLASKIRQHREFGKRLFWLESADDSYLTQLYKSASCLIAASEAEGFGLPIIEAAQHQLSIIARDIPVFREVAGEHAYYFSGAAPDNLSSAIESWLVLDAEGTAPTSHGMPWLNWEDSAEQLANVLLRNCGSDKDEAGHESANFPDDQNITKVAAL